MSTGPARRRQTRTGLPVSKPVRDVNVRVESLPSAAAMPADLTLLVLALPEGRALDLIKQIQSNPSADDLPIAILRMQSPAITGVPGLLGDGQSELPEKTQPPTDPFDKPVEVGEFVLDPSSQSASRAGRLASFTMLEFRLLYYLAARPNHLFTRNQLFKAIFSEGRSANPRIVDVYIRRIRLKLETDPEHPTHLKTSRGVGYFVDPCSRSPHEAE